MRKVSAISGLTLCASPRLCVSALKQRGLTGLKLGVLVNFGVSRIVDDFERVVNGL